VPQVLLLIPPPSLYNGILLPFFSPLKWMDTARARHDNFRNFCFPFKWFFFCSFSKPIRLHYALIESGLGIFFGPRHIFFFLYRKPHYPWGPSHHDANFPQAHAPTDRSDVTYPLQSAYDCVRYVTSDDGGECCTKKQSPWRKNVRLFP